MVNRLDPAHRTLSSTRSARCVSRIRLGHALLAWYRASLGCMLHMAPVPDHLCALAPLCRVVCRSDLAHGPAPCPSVFSVGEIIFLSSEFHVQSTTVKLKANHALVQVNCWKIKPKIFGAFGWVLWLGTWKRTSYLQMTGGSCLLPAVGTTVEEMAAAP